MCFFLQTIRQFNSKYPGLFGHGHDESEEGDNQGGGTTLSEQFNRRYGWIYSTREIARHEGISMDEAFELSITQTLNDLAFMKGLAQYERELMRKHNSR
jgi:hypothetical protein